jgi:hypothetical protein
MKVFVGNLMRLAGKTRHGKNRIRENGDMWRVITVDGGDSSILTTKVCVRPMNLERRDEWRWIDLPSDEHMEIIEHIE